MRPAMNDTKQPVPMFRGAQGRADHQAVRYTLTIEALPASTPAAIRLRRALKALLRGFKLRCIAVQEQPPATCTSPDVIIPPGAEDDPSKWLVKLKRPKRAPAVE
jgi:hypothetical protein